MKGRYSQGSLTGYNLGSELALSGYSRGNKANPVEQNRRVSILPMDAQPHERSIHYSLELPS